MENTTAYKIASKNLELQCKYEGWLEELTSEQKVLILNLAEDTALTYAAQFQAAPARIVGEEEIRKQFPTTIADLGRYPTEDEDDGHGLFWENYYRQEGARWALSSQLSIVTKDDIADWLDKYGFRVPYDRSNEFYDKEAIKHAKAGIEWALSRQTAIVLPDEEYGITFGAHLQCKVKISNNNLEVVGAVNGWGDSVPLTDITIEKIKSLNGIKEK